MYMYIFTAHISQISHSVEICASVEDTRVERRTPHTQTPLGIDRNSLPYAHDDIYDNNSNR